MTEYSSPFFSVIVPVFNVERYIRQCISSVLNQTYEDFELILVNDGSTDSSLVICNEFSNNHKVHIIDKSNGGLVSARKTGLGIAKGKYVVCLDGDDFLDNDYLSKFFNIICKYSPEVVCCDYYNYFDNGKSLPRHMDFCGYYDRERIIKEIFPFLIRSADDKYFPPSLWAKAFKIESYKRNQINVDEKINIGEDGACVIPLVIDCQSIFCFNECLYNYRRNINSITKVRQAKSFSQLDCLVDYLQLKINKDYFDFANQLNRKIVHDLFYFSSSQFYSKAKYSQICHSIKQKIDSERYKVPVNNSFFKGNFLSCFMRIALKKKLFFLIKLYSIFAK